MIEQVIALLMIVDHEIKEHRIQPNMSECLKGKRIANRTVSDNIEYKKLNYYRYRQKYRQTNPSKPHIKPSWPQPPSANP